MPSFAVLDACAMLAYAKNEPGHELVLDFLTDPDLHCCAHAVNVCEVYYYFLRQSGQIVADSVVRDFVNAGVVVREDLDPPFWRQVGQNKVSFTLALGDCFCLTLALGDCFCLALAQQLGGEVVTSDHQFDPVKAQGVCPVRFIR